MSSPEKSYPGFQKWRGQMKETIINSYQPWMNHQDDTFNHRQLLTNRWQHSKVTATVKLGLNWQFSMLNYSQGTQIIKIPMVDRGFRNEFYATTVTLVTTWCWWLYVCEAVCDRTIMLVTFSMNRNCHRHLKVVTNKPLQHFVTNIDEAVSCLNHEVQDRENP